jgi:hypothetical protein
MKISLQNLPVMTAAFAGLLTFQTVIDRTPIGHGVSGFVVNLVLLTLASRVLKDDQI